MNNPVNLTGVSNTLLSQGKRLLEQNGREAPFYQGVVDSVNTGVSILYTVGEAVLSIAFDVRLLAEATNQQAAPASSEKESPLG